jgi:hypothetical protein|uniref:Oleate-activated transcription factor 1 n=1 Tax=Nucleocytoviricota sp. TaxID=2809609 RepID=A0A9E8G429_9VIRU|nr:hypothetical protein [Nucleocytoviricota sp.]UZT29296.1 oleate-activated transcription factor 1 [Nucleocytoviricota sp.]
MTAYKCKTCLQNFYCLFEKCDGCDGCLALDKYGVCEYCNSSPKNVEDLNKIVKGISRNMQDMQETISDLNDMVIALKKEVSELKICK